MTTTTTGRLTPDEAGLVFVTPAAYADEARFHEACRVLRQEDPVHLVESADFLPFHVLTKHADVLEVELHNKEWENAPRPVVTTHVGEAHRQEHGELLRTLIHMDDPDHRAYRTMTAEWFLPKNLAKLDARLAASPSRPSTRWRPRARRATSPRTSPCRSRCR